MPMSRLQNLHWKNVVPPAAIVDNDVFVVNDVDTVVAGLGKAHEAAFIVALGATDIAMAALSVEESDDDSDYAAISESAFLTTALPQADDDNKVFGIFIPMEGRKRYLRLVATAGNGTNGTYLACVAALDFTDEQPKTTAQRGLEGERFTSPPSS
jgi:hypothetical protein